MDHFVLIYIDDIWVIRWCVKFMAKHGFHFLSQFQCDIRLEASEELQSTSESVLPVI